MPKSLLISVLCGLGLALMGRGLAASLPAVPIPATVSMPQMIVVGATQTATLPMPQMIVVGATQTATLPMPQMIVVGATQPATLQMPQMIVVGKH